VFKVSPASIYAMRHRRFRWRGAVGALILGPMAFVTLFSTPLVPGDSWWQLPIRATAWACFLAGAAFRFWATLYIGGRKDAELVTSGPYSICRHPLYVGSLLLGITAGLFLESLAFSVAMVIVMVIYQQTTVRAEEGALRARHGLDFEDYARRVPRFWPSLRTFRTPDHINVHMHSLWNECARASRWVWLPALGDILMHLRTQAWWPTFFHRL
jgi:protein-S-isoprenylcysteine O-methyltransferase Ste14